MAQPWQNYFGRPERDPDIQATASAASATGPSALQLLQSVSALPLAPHHPCPHLCAPLPAPRIMRAACAMPPHAPCRTSQQDLVGATPPSTSSSDARENGVPIPPPARATLPPAHRRTSLQNLAGATPPSTSSSDAREYGTLASSTVLDAPGTCSSHVSERTPPPVAYTTAMDDDAWMAATSASTATPLSSSPRTPPVSVHAWAWAAAAWSDPPAWREAIGGTRAGQGRRHSVGGRAANLGANRGGVAAEVAEVAPADAAAAAASPCALMGGRRRPAGWANESAETA
eukprot:363540-Chlamydomonas_euryale.AAC.1